VTCALCCTCKSFTLLLYFHHERHHEHVSIPFNPMDNQASPITDPDSLDMPDYGAVCQSSPE
jgi:hypothetical protein